MNNDIITQNIKLMDEKMIIDKHYQVKEDNRLLDVYEVSRQFEPVICKRCGALVCKIKEYKKRTIRTFINFNIPIKFVYNQRRLLCDCGKTMCENNTMVGKRKAISNLTRLNILNLCKKKISFKDISNITNCTSSTVIDIFMSAAGRDRLKLTDVICVDEFYSNIRADDKYACIIGDPQSNKIIDIIDSRHYTVLEEYLSKIPLEERQIVKIVIIDMWMPYKVIFSRYCPNCIIAVDPFHWIKQATDNFHKIRKKVELQTYNPKVKSFLRNQWRIFSKYNKHLNEKKYYRKSTKSDMSELDIVEYCINSDKRLEVAWHLLQKIYKFEKECTEQNAPSELKDLIEELEASGYEEMIDIAKTYRNWFTEICNSFKKYGTENKRCSNGFIEGKNSFIKTINKIAFGFNNFAIYKARILYISDNDGIHIKDDKENRKKFKKIKQKRKGGK